MIGLTNKSGFAEACQNKLDFTVLNAICLNKMDLEQSVDDTEMLKWLNKKSVMKHHCNTDKKNFI